MTATRAGRLAARVGLAAAGSGVGVALAARQRAFVGPVQLEGRVRPGRGGLRVELPPFGHADVRAFRGPLTATAVAVGVDPSRAEGLLAMPTDAADAAAIHGQFQQALHATVPQLRALGLRLLGRTALAGVGGAAALAAVHDRRDVLPAAALATGGLVTAAAIGAATLDRESWRTPRLDGLLAKAPLILGDLRTAPSRVTTYRDQLADLVRTGTSVYRHVAELPAGPPPDAIRLLHVSDIHLSPFAFPLITAMVQQYGIDAVLDTGDLVDWGTPPEQALAGEIGKLGVPYVFVKGNHDSTGIADAVARQRNARVLSADGGVVEVAGLRLAGMGDPRFTPDKTTGDDHAEQRVTEAADAFAARIEYERADVALVHDPAAARAISRVGVPLVLAGHWHFRDARQVGGTTVLVEGTTGGSGLRGVQRTPPDPLSMSVLFLNRAAPHTTWGTDAITVGGLGATDVVVQRRTVAALLDEATTRRRSRAGTAA